MRAASQPVSFSLRSIASAMFLSRARPTRLAVVYLLFTVALILVPKADILETPFDEANTPTNEIVIEKTPSLCNLDSRTRRVHQKNLRSHRGLVSTGSYRFTRSC